MSGSSPQATPIQLQAPRPPKPPPGWDFAKAFFDQIAPQLMNQQKPSYQGQVDPGLSPTMQNVIRGAQTFSQSPVPNSLEQASGTLGAFQNFDKLPGSDFQYQMDPSHQAMYGFQQPTYQNPAQGQGPAPNYGFGVPGMAEGGAGGYGADKIVKMAAGGAGGMADAFFDTIGPVPVGDYWMNGPNLAFNPGPAGGMLGDSRFGNFWEGVQGMTGFQPGQQHGPNAEFWSAIPPAGFNYGRGGQVDPVTGDEHPWGWWSPSGPGGVPQMPDWLAGLNDEEMAEVFRLGGNVPDFMRGPGDDLAEREVGRDLGAHSDPGFGSGRTPAAPAGGKKRGGGGGGMNLSYSPPGYNPTQVTPSFVSWDPGNPEISMEERNIMPPRMEPPMMPPPGGGGGGGGGGRPGGGGGGGGGSPRPGGGGPPAAAQGPPMGAPMPGMPQPAGGGSSREFLQYLANAFRGMGGNVDKGFRWGGAGSASPGPDMPAGVDMSIQMMAEGNVVDHPQLAMIGEAGPEVVLPLTREAADPRLKKMQQQLGLPATPMATGGGGGMQGSWQDPNWNRAPGGGGVKSINGGGLQSYPMPWGGGAGSRPPMQRSPGTPWNQLSMGPGSLPGGGVGGMNFRSFEGRTPWMQSGLDQVSALRGQGGSNEAQNAMLRGNNQLSTMPFPAPGGDTSGWSSAPRPTTLAPGGGFMKPGQSYGNDMIARPLGPTPSPGKDFTTTQLPAPAPLGAGSTPQWQQQGFGSRGHAQDAFNRWSEITGNQQGLSLQDYLKPSQANWQKEKFLQNNPYQAPGAPGGETVEGPGFTSGPAPPPGGTQVAPVPPGAPPIQPFPPTPGGPPQVGGVPGQQPPPGGGMPPGQASPFGPTSAMDVYRSAVPVMNQAMDDAISRSTASAGMTGNRFGTSTERNAMDIGRRGALEQNQLMGNLLYNQTQADQDRALQATGMGLEDARFRNQLQFQGGQNALDRAMQAAGLGQSGAALQHQMAQDKLTLPFQIGAWEQGRQDQYSRLPYDEFMRDRDGYLSEIMNLIGGTGGSGGMSGQWGTQQTGGSPGFADYLGAFAPYLSLFMAKGGAGGYGASDVLGGY